MQKYKITVIGAGYVGMSLAVLLSQKYKVQILDIDKERVNLINNGKSTISDQTIEQYLNDFDLNLSATERPEEAFKDSDFFIISTPTNYDSVTQRFDTDSVEGVIQNIIQNTDDGLIVIKSTIPVGFTKEMNLKYKTDRVTFSPEFLREGKALDDNLYPSRIIVGSDNKKGIEFSKLLLSCTINKDVPVLFIGSDEAEAVKLFANTYLAMRVAYFNEIDSYGLHHNLNVKDIILGVSLDHRIGHHYNNPSFGYGGYCLPKDTKQLLANFDNVPPKLIRGIVESNETRKQVIVNHIISKKPKVVGVYGLAMKQGSDNFRFSAIQGIIESLNDHNLEIIIFEESLEDQYFLNCKVCKDFEKFKKVSDIVIANRMSDNLNSISEKVFTRDIFQLD